MTGYSNRPVWAKLGLQDGMRVRFADAPENFDHLLALPFEVSPASRGPYDYVHIFTDNAARLRLALQSFRDGIRPSGMIWVSWHKKSSGLQLDVNEDTVREIALPLGLVDVKVCSIDNYWSGLKLVIRKELRPAAVADSVN